MSEKQERPEQEQQNQQQQEGEQQQEQQEEEQQQEEEETGTYQRMQIVDVCCSGGVTGVTELGKIRGKPRT
jgi:hypothetical protein